MEVDQKGEIKRSQNDGRQCEIVFAFFITCTPIMRFGQETSLRRKIFFRKSPRMRSGLVIFQQVEFS